MDVVMKLREIMILELNEDLKDTCLKYVKEGRFGEEVISYRLKVVDKYIKLEYQNIPDITKEFEDRVKTFFKEKYGVTDLGYSNSIIVLNAWK